MKSGGKNVNFENQRGALWCRTRLTGLPHRPSTGEQMESFDNELLEGLAEAAHQVWMEGKLREGWQYGPVIDKDNKVHSGLVPYEELSEADKESDRDMVRGIPKILSAAGYKIVKA